MVSMNTVVSSWPTQFSRALNVKANSAGDGENSNLVEDLSPIEDKISGEQKLFLPFTGNGYIGLAANSKNGLFVHHMKSLSLPIVYNPLARIYLDNLEKKGEPVLNLSFLKCID